VKRSPPGEAKSHSVGQEIPCISWNLKVHCHVHKSSPQDHQMNTHNFVTLCFFKIHIVILTSMPRSTKWYLPFRFRLKFRSDTNPCWNVTLIMMWINRLHFVSACIRCRRKAT